MNHYTKFLEDFFMRLVELRQYTNRIRLVLENSIKGIEKIDNGTMIHGSALVIKDWTNFSDPLEIRHTGIRKRILKDNYSEEVNKIIYQEFCFAFAQSFESFETFLKNCIFFKIQNAKDFHQKVNIPDPNQIKREEVPSGDKLYSWIKKACGNFYKNFFEKNNENLNYTEYWKTIAIARHAITHSSSTLRLRDIDPNNLHLLETIFSIENIDSETIKLRLNFYQFCDLINKLGEFAFQIFKMISLDENLDWDILKSSKNISKKTA